MALNNEEEVFVPLRMPFLYPQMSRSMNSYLISCLLFILKL